MDQQTEQRPWGSFTVLMDADNFKAKRLDVLPGKRLSLQSHQHRSEHWIIVTGLAKMTVGDELVNYSQGQHIFVPQKSRHRIENIGNTLLTIVEVQLGEYFGEDDIVRYEDDFERPIGHFEKD
jgi:mannose-1-phosphate guanylyltransferase/mannose-6-phosphate isomerase